MGEPVSGWLDRSGVRLHYLEWKPDGDPAGPAVLLLHGLSSNARYWERVARHLGGGRRLVALDQRGHGLTGRPPQSPVLPDGYGMDALLDDVTTAVSELDLGRPVVVGHSWGATIALELVGTRPKLASGLVFIDGPVQSAANLFSWDDAQRIMQPPLPRYGSFAEAVADSRRDFEGAWGDDLEPFVTARIVRDRDGLILTLTAPARLELLRGLYESQPDMLWSQVTVPAVALLALQSFSRFSKSKEDGAARLAVIAPAVEVRWLDSPHDIPLFMPADVASEIERICILASADLASEAPAG